jgi:hypothetical protein
MKAATPIPSESIRALSPFVPAQAGTQVNACGICGTGSPLARRLRGDERSWAIVIASRAQAEMASAATDAPSSGS